MTARSSSTERSVHPATRVAIEHRARLRAVDLPAPSVGQVERAAGLTGVAVRHVEESTTATAAVGASGLLPDPVGSRPLGSSHRLDAIRSGT